MSARVIQYGASEDDAERYRSLVAQFGSPLLVVDRGRLLKQLEKLRSFLPGAGIYYAVKAFPYPDILRILADAGCHFDVASAGEIDLVTNLGVSGRRTIHTHPFKKAIDIKAALRGGSTTFVVDNLDELRKLVPYRQRVGVLLRVSFRSPSAAVDLSRKFGCMPENVEQLVLSAKQLGVHIRGLSFHVGSQSLTPDSHVEAINHCAMIIDSINQKLDNPMNVLDIGGGFPVSYGAEEIDEAAYFAPVTAAISALPADINVIAEPGRYLIAPAVTGIASVIGKASRGNVMWYYLDDGVYGSYSGQIFDHVTYPLQVLNDSPDRAAAIIAGPTCDSIDVIAEDVQLPALDEGDLLIGHAMGAYTYATATRFNSVDAARVVITD